jgi:uncharacterized membrane-anchored protein
MVFGVTNGMIAYKEATIRNGTTMYLELAPRDPRSLMQGDYMALRYNLNNARTDRGWRGKFVVRLHDNKVAEIIRAHDGEALSENEHLLRYTRGSRGTRIGTDSFFFQEGHGKHYANARYGELKVSPGGERVLVGLRNADLSKAKPPTGK